MPLPPILRDKHYAHPSLFTPDALLREARRQKRLAEAKVPPVCLLDPDGDLARHLRANGDAAPFRDWACYHTTLDTFALDGKRVGIIGGVIGASYAVLVAEELFASGCETLVSLTSAGQIRPAGNPPYFVLIDRALRDEGASYHYLAPSDFAEADKSLVAAASAALHEIAPRSYVGASWTTDAPFRETAAAIEIATELGILAVEMEAAALYAFARATGVRVLCLAHVTNTMGRSGDDFEKGEADGALEALEVLAAVIRALRVRGA